MKKFLVIIFLLIILLIAFLGLVYKFFPQIGYYLVTNNYYKGEWYNVGKIDSFLLEGSIFKFDKRIDGSDDHKWQNFSIKDYTIPLPVNHPLYFALPIIEIKNNNYIQLGAEFRDQKGETLLKFKPVKTERFDFLVIDQKLFELTWSQKIFSRVDQNTIWKDLFSFTIPKDPEEFYNKNSLRIIYFLYQIALRKKILEENIEKYSFNSKNNSGIIQYKTEEGAKFLKEKIYFFIDGLLEPFILETRIGNYFAEDLRIKMIENTKFNSSSADEGKKIYNNFMTLPYREKISTKGMYYLYSTWSHDLLNEDLLKNIISLLERGKGNINYISPFYSFSFKKFGTNFSTKKDVLRENQTLKLDKKIIEEENKTIQMIENENNTENRIRTPLEEKIKYHLKKAKEDQDVDDENNEEASLSFD